MTISVKQMLAGSAIVAAVIFAPLAASTPAAAHQTQPAVTTLAPSDWVKFGTYPTEGSCGAVGVELVTFGGARQYACRNLDPGKWELWVQW